MFLVTTVVYPPDKSIKVAEKFMEVMAKPLPPFMKRLQVLGNSRIDLGAKILSVFEIDDEKVKEGIIELTRFYVQFNDIKGFTFEIEAMLTPEESIPLLGITMP